MSDKKKIPFQGMVTYFKEVRAELKKVIWPTFKQIKNNTTIVIICLLFVGAIIWMLDLGFKTTLGKVVDLAGNSTEQTTPQSQGNDAVPNGNVGNGLTPDQQDAPAQSNDQ